MLKLHLTIMTYTMIILTITMKERGGRENDTCQRI